ncbi:MAG: lipopolysaccharide biosynthesis protein [Pseudomonadota bacterium]
MTGLHRHLTGYLPINLFQAIITLASLSFFTRLLTPREYGLYALCTTAILWAQGLLFYGLTLGMGRFVESARQTGQLPALISTTYSLFAILAVGVILVSACLAVLWDDPLPWILSGAVLLIRSWVQMGLEIHRNSRRVVRFSTLEGLQYGLTLVLGVALIEFCERPALAPLWGLLLANLMVLLLDARCWRAPMGRHVFYVFFSRDKLRELIHYAAPLTLAYLMSLVVANGDRFLIAWLMDQGAVGQYAVAYGLADRPLAILFNWVGMATTPLLFAAMQRQGIDGAIRVMEDTVRTLILFALPVAAGLAAVAEPLAAVLVGTEFQAEVARLLPWLAFSSVLHGFMVHYLAHAFLAAQQTITLLWTFLAAAALNIVLNLLLIPPFGLRGAALATVAAYALGLGLRGWRARCLMPVPLPLVTLGKGLLACAFMVAIVRGFAFSHSVSGLLLAILTGMILYGLASLMLNVAEVRTRGLAWIRQ